MSKTDKEPGVSVPQSPRFFRRKLAPQNNESTSTAQGKVVLGEVEEKLKSMRQKRLDRLSMFVVEQSKLSEERSNKDKEGDEIEDAIMSIKQAKEEKKFSFKSIAEENMSENKHKTVTEVKIGTPKLPRKSSNEFEDKSKQLQKPSSTKKFINKFNCTTTAQSTEDLTGSNEYKKSDSCSVVVSERHHNQPQLISRSSLQEDKGKAVDNTINKTDINYNYNVHKKEDPISTIVSEKLIYNKPQLLNRNSLQEDKAKAVDNANNKTESNSSYNPLLTPVGKQRTGIYLYDTECKFLENDNLTVTSTFIKNEKNSLQGVASLAVPNRFVKETSPRTSLQEERVKEHRKSPLHTTIQDTATDVIIEVKPRNSFENRVAEASNNNRPLLMKTFKSNSFGDNLDIKVDNKSNLNTSQSNLHVDNKSNTSISETKGVNTGIKVYENAQLTSKENVNVKNTGHRYRKKSNETNFPVPPKSPVPLPRRVTNEERILKKFQRNWDSLNEIIENDSDVDGDEIEDLRKTSDEVNALLIEYQTKLNKLEGKSKGKDTKLNEVKAHLKEVQNETAKFKGLKRDVSYRELRSKLTSCLVEVDEINNNKIYSQRDKQLIAKEAQNCKLFLESIILRNEKILQEVLEAQVTSISTNILNITKV